MNWGRAKTILIILFLLIDIFLLTLLAVVQNNVSFIEDKTVKETVSVLNSRGIEVSQEQISTKREKDERLELENILLTPHTLAERFLGKNFETAQENENGSVYIKGISTLFISENEFSLEENREVNYVFSFDDTYNPLMKALKKLGFKKKDICFQDYYIKDGVCHITAYQTFNDKKINSAKMIISSDGDGILNMSGRFYVNISSDESDKYLTDVTSVLCNMIYDPVYHNISVKKIEVRFVNEEENSENSKIYAYPVYVVADTKNREYILNDFN